MAVEMRWRNPPRSEYGPQVVNYPDCLKWPIPLMNLYSDSYFIAELLLAPLLAAPAIGRGRSNRPSTTPNEDVSQAKRSTAHRRPQQQQQSPRSQGEVPPNARDGRRWGGTWTGYRRRNTAQEARVIRPSLAEVPALKRRFVPLKVLGAILTR